MTNQVSCVIVLTMGMGFFYGNLVSHSRLEFEKSHSIIKKGAHRMTTIFKNFDF